MNTSVSAHTLQEMKAYYHARAGEYDESYSRQGRYDQGPERNARWFTELDEVFTALDAFHLEGEVLELAAGMGTWTRHLIHTASTVTAVDASPQMLALNRAKVGSPRVWYVLADLFCWHPERVYDAIFCGFWLSHVPRERLDAFLRSCITMLHPEGKIFLAIVDVPRTFLLLSIRKLSRQARSWCAPCKMDAPLRSSKTCTMSLISPHAALVLGLILQCAKPRPISSMVVGLVADDNREHR